MKEAQAELRAAKTAKKEADDDWVDLHGKSKKEWNRSVRQQAKTWGGRGGLRASTRRTGKRLESERVSGWWVFHAPVSQKVTV